MAPEPSVGVLFTHWVSTGHETRYQSLLLCILTVHINVLEPGAFNPESQYFVPLFNRIP